MASTPDQARRAAHLAVVGFVGLVVLAAGLAVWALDVDPALGWAWFTAGALLAGFAGYLGGRRSLARTARATRRLPRGGVLLAAVAGAGLGALLWEAVTPEQLMAVLGLGAGLITGLLLGSRPRTPRREPE